MATTRSPKRITRDHPALAAAKRTIRRSLSRLTAAQVFQLADMVHPAGRWDLSVSYAATVPEHHWKCEDVKPNKGAR